MVKVALIGAGAVGAYFIDGFESAKDIAFTLVADGERAKRLAREGVMINGRIRKMTVRTPKGAGEQDLILVATKYSGIFEAAKMIPPMVGEDTIVLSLLNGVDSEEIIAKEIGKEKIVHGFMRIASRRTDEGIVFNPNNTVGAIYGAEWCEESKAKRVEEIFQMAPAIHQRRSERILSEMWEKYAGNVSTNLPQAVLNSPIAVYRYEHGAFLVKKLWDEVKAVANAKGITIPDEPDMGLQYPGRSRYSTLQDLDAKRHTEVDMFAGRMIEMAKEYNISVPFCEYTYHAIKAIEQRNDGVFDE